MYNTYKAVINTAAGRRRYMQYLIPYILESNIVDRYDIWINTHNGADIAEKCDHIDYSKVNRLLAEKQASSRDYLVKALQK